MQWAVSGSVSAPTSSATFVEHVFGWILETRSCCAECGHGVRQKFEAADVLVLPIPEEESSAAVTPTELYMRYCAPKVVEMAGAIISGLFASNERCTHDDPTCAGACVHLRRGDR